MKTRIVLALSLGLSACIDSRAPAPQVWRLDGLGSIGGHRPEVLGAPRPVREGRRHALCFDGVDDGLILPVNPIRGMDQFSIEVLFRPEGDGPEEQRFLHIQDEQEHRVLIETRVTKERTWALDTFLRASDRDRLTLLDRSRVQPADQWYWVSLVYDGKTMLHYVNGKKQLDGEVAFPPMGQGRLSLGVRLNKIHWFKGCIAEVRFHAKALPEKANKP
jgi:hypothetical protein